ncbi:TPR domain protein [Oceanicola granulosus HTCC2516]|uniref:TPR domain protein n=1 Tax=Oceanicola granulosus (strain ATCC BAA-861 / DSM 15982 / KCTC 12143 / HTCC2516) TaxID=314256 RepID=Q2CCG2_OCEGH|nr:tetratricopeptide repeat protein [Oceanicola granulosus]EAR50356.1 TPR domain protein [Oceanicola granulosus HTCC2516]
MDTSSFRRLALAAGLGIVTAGTAGVAHAQNTSRPGNAGVYLAARQASQAGDFRAAAEFFQQAHARDRANGYLLENAIAALVAVHDMERAAELAEQAHVLGVRSQVANMVSFGAAAEQGDWRRVFNDLEAGLSVGPLVDGLAQAWAFVGLEDAHRAEAAFDAVIETPGLTFFGLYHKALGRAVLGDLAGAEAILSLPPEDGLLRTRRVLVLRAEVLSRLGRAAEAARLIDTSFPPPLDHRLTALRAALETGAPLPPTIAGSAREGLAEAFFSVADAVQGETADSYTLLYSRLSEHLAPGNDAATLMSGELLESLERFHLASDAYRAVSPDSPAYIAAELGRAGALRKAGAKAEAAEVLRALVAAHETATVQASLGDVLRQLGEHGAANAAYSRALEIGDAADRTRWFIHYTRGITFQKLGDWDSAEADFRAALALEPDQPQVLNYLGYSLVELDSNLEEALGMIRTAAAARPENGSIVDSLGWALFRLGHYAEAVAHLERAAELDPTRAVIVNHLGDAYWAVGRRTEARFQWRRALSFGPEEALAVQLRDKLEHGLETARISEDEPIQVAHEDGL